MKSKPQRYIKAEGSKTKGQSDVSPTTSLPPLVEGQLRCFLRVTISRLVWTLHRPPSATYVRLRWWGESSNGTHFFPRDGSQPSQKTVKTTARFPIRSGPKQFTSYLTDMGSLVLEVMTKSDNLPVARAQVAGISSLTLSHPVSGFYNLVSPTSDKMGELQVTLNLEALTEAYESSSSGRTRDMSIEVLQATTLTAPSQPTSLGSREQRAVSSTGDTPRGKDRLYFQNTQNGKEESTENQIPIANGEIALNSCQESSGQRTNDILSVILERGNKLRDAMVVSALKSEMDSASTLKITPLLLPKDNILPHSKLHASSSGIIHQNILHACSTLKRSDDVAAALECGADIPADIDIRAVDLLLASIDKSFLPFVDGEDSLYESLSGHSSVCGNSELNDPQYDQSLLENLFYKTPGLDITPNDPETEGQGKVSWSKKQLTPSGSQMSHGLNEEQMKLLSLIRFVIVTINSLTVPTCSANAKSRKTFTKGRTLQPLTCKKSTYFIEYEFPLVSTSIHHKGIDGEVTTAVSSKVTEGVVNFHHHSVFPVNISAATVMQWWETDLMFKIYSRKSYQKKFVLIGKTVHPLSSLLQSKQLSQSVVLPVQSMEGNSEAQEVGPLKVALELAVRKAFPSHKSKTALPSKDKRTTQTAVSPEQESSSNAQHVDFGREELLSCSFEDSRLNVLSPQITSKEPSPHSSLHKSYKSQQQGGEDPEVLLHTLLMVTDGTNFNYGPKQGPNVYLNCKLFWCDEMTRSVVSWGQTNPSFNFVQVTPIALSNKLLERLKNNMMVIEVWQKTANSGQDRLFGLVKLPLHQFYLSFRDPKIAHLLLQSEHPVLGVDSYMPVTDVFSGSCKGNLRVVLAMGRAEQIASLQRTRCEVDDCLPHIVRPVHLLDLQPYSQNKIPVQKQSMREHRFIIKVERVGGLTPLQSTVWGEADCYVQYNFPIKESDPAAEVDRNVIESSLNLKLFRTTTTLCVPDPVFGHSETHVLLAPDGVPVQRLLLSSLSRQGLTNGGGVQFEVWCRYYYPNVRDQLVAKGILPLSKLCAMVTMQGQKSDEAQMFSLPLVPRMDRHTGHPPQPSGLLDVSIQYKQRLVRAEGQTGKGAASRIVTIAVEVHRASGLQAAARIICEQDERFNYYASVGVNTYVTVKFTFQPESERSCTRIVARTFCPEFDHHMEVSCNLLTQTTSGETCSLAEKLEDACAVFTVWHRHSPKDSINHKPKDVMLGTVKVPLADLLHKRSEKGISGWFGVYSPQESGSTQHQQIMVGGLEISVSFAHHTDKIRVIKAAHGVGWEIAQAEVQDADEAWRENMTKMSFTFSMPRAWLPTDCLLLPGHTELQRSTYCYFRYMFYDQDAFYSQMRHPSFEQGEEEGLATVTFQGSKNVEVRSTQPLKWYLRDEKLEVQVWVAFKKDKTQKPRDTDRLVGSAFVDLSLFAKTPKQKLTLSGVYPLFRCSAADLQGAALRVHITLKTGFMPSEEEAEADNLVDADGQGEPFSEEFEAADRTSSPITPKKAQIKHNKSSSTSTDVTSVQHAEKSMDESFPVNVAVDRAMHLSLKGCPIPECSEGSPCCCVSYVTVDSPEPVSTAVIANTDCPVWDHQNECRLSKQLLVDPQLSLLFKVWHQGEVERVIGFASVDLSPLQCGFPSVCGWYHITDLSGQCHGQLKVSITPLKRLQDHREQRTTVNENTAINSSALFQPLLLSYQTKATYSSFPAHISQYPEQKISSSDLTDGLISERSIYSDRHFEHMDQVRLYHQSLQEQTVSNSVCSSSAGEIHPSSSAYSALRKKLSDLDNIQRYFSSKFSAPTFSSRSEQDFQTEQEERRNMEKCLGGPELEMIPSRTQSSSTTPPTGENILETLPETSGPDTPKNCGHDHIFLQKISEDHTDSEPEEMRDRLSFQMTESEDENEDGANKDEEATGCRQDKEADDDEEDEEYEEVMMKPRPLNEVTSFTDKTSPWASILSDPELVSPERVEALEDQNMSADEDEGWQTTRLQIRDISWPQKCGDQDESNSFSGSTKESPETDGDDKRAEEALVEGRIEEAGSDEGSSEECSSPTTHDSKDNTHDASTSPEGRGPLQLAVPWEVPNFFLPSDQMEASMRVIRLAPSFPRSIDDLQRSPPGLPRVPRQPCNMSPSSRKKEMERIAKIFASHLHDD